MFFTVRGVLSSLLFWEVTGYVCTGIVIFGCVGEYIAEFTRIPKNDDERHRISKLSLIILTAGIAGELLTAVQSSRISAHVISDLQATVQDAKKSASDAADAATRANIAANGAESRAETVGKEADQAEAKILAVGKETDAVQKESIEAQIGMRQYIEQISMPRRICDPRLGCIEENDPALRKKWRDEVAKFAGTHAIIQPLANNGEAMDVARGIENLLNAEGWFPEIVDAEHSKVPNGYILPGVTLVTLEPSPFKYGPPPEVKLVPLQPSALFHATAPLMGLLALDLGPNRRMPNILGVMFNTELDDERDRMLTRYGFRFPPNTMLILVGEKPAPNWIGSNVPLTNSATKRTIPPKK